MDKDIKFLVLKEVIQITRLPRSTIYMLMTEHRFPKSYKLTDRKVIWLESEVREWMNKVIFK